MIPPARRWDGPTTVALASSPLGREAHPTFVGTVGEGLGREIIEDGIAAGVFGPVHPAATGEAIYTALEGARMYQVTLGANRATLTMRDVLFRYVVRELLTDEYLVADVFAEEPA